MSKESLKQVEVVEYVKYVVKKASKKLSINKFIATHNMRRVVVLGEGNY